jgi:hypothetical protein
MIINPSPSHHLASRHREVSERGACLPVMTKNDPMAKSPGSSSTGK